MTSTTDRLQELKDKLGWNESMDIRVTNQFIMDLIDILLTKGNERH